MECNENLLKEDKLQYHKEQDELLKTVLNARFFRPWRGMYSSMCNGTTLQDDSNLEIFITNKCNQNCEYCYLNNEGLYPKNGDNPDVILKNLQILYEYIIANDFYIPEIEMFSGEIWHTKLGLDVLELTYQYTLKGLSYKNIIIPSNCFFCNNPVTMQQVQRYINKFNEIGSSLRFSISIDGKFADNAVRPRNSKEQYTDEFYDNVFAFAKHNGFCFHPMLSASNIKSWHENYKWWKEMHDYYNLDMNKMMYLEVRNNDWTDELISDYCNFLIELADDFLINTCKNNIQTFANIMAMIRNPPPVLDGYTPWFLQLTDTMPSCTIGTHLMVRLGDLAIVPCHRTAYNKYLYGYFIVEDNKIIDIKAQNPQMAIQILMSNQLVTNPKCDTCLWNIYCLHGCLGSQLEQMKDPFFPIPGVCKMLNAKYSCLLQYYKDRGIIDYYKSINAQEMGSDYVLSLLKVYTLWEEQRSGMGTY